MKNTDTARASNPNAPAQALPLSVLFELPDWERHVAGATMHYWQLHIGDWSKSCGHLSAAETGFYIRLLNVYYDTEKPIPADIASACRLAGARTSKEREEVARILSDYFVIEQDGWHNKRADSEINRLNGVSKKRADAAHKRWQSKCDADDMQMHSGSRALQDTKTPIHQDQDQKLPTTSVSSAKADDENDGDDETDDGQDAGDDPGGKVTDLVPYQKLVDAYNERCGELFPRVSKLTDKRRRKIRAAWKFDTTNQDERRRTNSLDYWSRYFDRCTNVEHFRKAALGENTGQHAGWMPGFDFLIREDTWLGVREGRYAVSARSAS